MASVGKRKVELSNLTKVLFPADGFVKAEVVQYYLSIAPTILRHIRGRALTLIRFPDGIDGETFYQKNRPGWAPDWVEFTTLGDEKKLEYIVATEEATLVWLANLACLELHQLHSRSPHHDRPDYIVYDLDPPEEYDFGAVVDLARRLREHLQNFGYNPFVKTTGRKGLHVVTPIEPRYSFGEAFEAAKKVAEVFVRASSTETTLHIKKESRKGRVLIDIYRNRPAQSIVSPYSLRGAPGAPVSMPLSWDQVAGLESPAVFNIETAPKQVLSAGDAWEAIGAYATGLHSDKTVTQRKSTGASRKHKTPEQLAAYAKKREFSKTPEPEPLETLGQGNAFVIHRHHASHLHYDLRLEEDGTLKSWAVPRGMPPYPSLKRLAVATEDHPLEYLNFEGAIPKGQYGAGSMWIYARGKYEKTKIKKDGFYFRLSSTEITAEYRMYETSNKQWLLERLDNPQTNWLKDPKDFMFAERVTEVPEGEYTYELKWDGIRAMIVIDEGEVRILSRNHRDITSRFPELTASEEAFRNSSGVFDGEIVCLDDEGRPSFRDVINRLHRSGESSIKSASQKHPAHCYLFDCLFLDGRTLINDPIERRRDWLADSVRRDSPYRVNESLDDGHALFNAVQQMGLEGIVAKEAGGLYYPGRRSRTWLKVKVRQSDDCVILGFTAGKGDRESYFGALQIGFYEDGELLYRGKVGTGFNTKQLKTLHAELRRIPQIDRPIEEKPADDNETTWIQPRLFCEVEYSQITGSGTFRDPVFVRMRPDLAPEDV
jgi:DNA ligase D-like protein (predicted ligase)/DNA ligase D-like protein (predicted polymerase)/DNA ligase D-like protein (predicted 3'-phosphoesterase)